MKRPKAYSKKKICCVFNYAPHYREAIFKKMDETFDVDFYFGNDIFSPLKKIDYNILKGFRKELKTIRLNRTYKWQSGIISVLKKKYDYYIITGDLTYISNWLLILYCNLFHKKIFLWCHGLKSKPDSFFQRKISELYYGNKMTELLLYGNYSRGIMIKEGFDEEKMHIIYNSLDYEKQTRIRNNIISSDNNPLANYFSNHDPVLIYIGRLQKEKKLEMILQAQIE